MPTVLSVLGVVLDHILGPQLPAGRSVRPPSQGVALLGSGSGLRLAKRAVAIATIITILAISPISTIGIAGTEPPTHGPVSTEERLQ